MIRYKSALSIRSSSPNALNNYSHLHLIKSECLLCANICTSYNDHSPCCSARSSLSPLTRPAVLAPATAVTPAGAQLEIASKYHTQHVLVESLTDITRSGAK